MSLLGGRGRSLAQGLGLQTWGTKSFEFWTFLAAALWLARPTTLLELGSGRSTSYLADYAQKTGATLVSIEQNRRFALRVRAALRLGFVAPGGVHHVPVRGTWYDLRRVQELTPVPCELLFVDGPVGAQESLGPALRDDAAAVRWLEPLAGGVRILVVDDVHRQPNLDLAERLAAAAGLDGLYLDYEPRPGKRNTAAVATTPDAAASLRASCTSLGIAVYEDRARVPVRRAKPPRRAAKR
jgi:predicted O-methyltransferase YrrM